MSEPRKYGKYIIVGASGEGKSPYIDQEILPAYDMRSQKVLVVTPTITKTWGKYTQISSLQPLFTRNWHGIFVYQPEDDDKMLFEVSGLIAKRKMVNGVVILEDFGGYIKANPQETVKKTLGNSKNGDCDFIGTAWTLDRVPKFMRQMINDITIFKTPETFKSAEEVRQLGYINYSIIYDVWKHVMAQPRIKPEAGKPRTWIQPHVNIKTGV